MSKDRNTEQLIKAVSKGAAEEVMRMLKLENINIKEEKKELSYYKRVEILLYNYENLKDAIKQKEEDIEYLEKHGLPEKSKSIVAYSSVGGNSKGDIYLELKEKYIRDKIEIERDLRRIDNALDKIRGDKYFDIIQLKYLSNEEEKVNKDDDIGEILEKDRRTIIRNRKRLINKLVTIFFPESIKVIM